jgi:hypothetical protein
MRSKYSDEKRYSWPIVYFWKSKEYRCKPRSGQNVSCMGLDPEYSTTNLYLSTLGCEKKRRKRSEPMTFSALKKQIALSDSRKCTVTAVDNG